MRNSTVQMAAVGTNKTQVSLTVGLETYTSTKKRTISENSMRCNTLKSINLEWRIIERSHARHLGFILTTTTSEGDFPIDVCRGYNASPSTAAHLSSPESNSQCHTQFHSLTIPAPPFPLVQERVHHTRTQTKKGHKADCLLSTPESLATWFLLTFNRVHYGGGAPVQLLLYTQRHGPVFPPAAGFSILLLLPLKPFTPCWPVTSKKGPSVSSEH